MPSRIRGPILNPQPNGVVRFIPDGVLIGDDHGRIEFVGPWSDLSSTIDSHSVRRSRGVILPAFLDAHIHIPQHPIRGQFMAGIDGDPPEGKLIAALNRNVFPAEARCSDPQYTREVVRKFLADTLAQGVVGGAAYMTVHPAAVRLALEMLPETWFVGLVLMNMNCPEYLRTDEKGLKRDMESLAKDFGQRVIVTDRFAVCVDSQLRRAAVMLAQKLGLRMQTHLNEQAAEKRFVEQTLYPGLGTYTDVYDRDGLLDGRPILAHCVHMSPSEFDLVRSKGACIAHCPTSNLLLGSGVMLLDLVRERGIEYAVCTDVGASPTTSLLYEMAQFLSVHAGRSGHATASEALCRTTLAPARMLRLDHELGSFEQGKSMTFVEAQADLTNIDGIAADKIIRERVLECDQPLSVSRMERKVLRTVVKGIDASAQA